MQTVTHDSVYVASRKGVDLSADQTLVVYHAVKTPLRGHDGEREDGWVWAMCQTESDMSHVSIRFPPKRWWQEGPRTAACPPGPGRRGWRKPLPLRKGEEHAFPTEPMKTRYKPLHPPPKKKEKVEVDSWNLRQ